MNTQAFKKGDIIFHEGDTSTDVYKIADGAVDVFTDYGAANQNFLLTRPAGAFIGEFASLVQEPRSATAVASTDCTLEVYSVEELLNKGSFTFDYVESFIHQVMVDVDQVLRRYVAQDMPSYCVLPHVVEERRRVFETYPEAFAAQFKKGISYAHEMHKMLAASITYTQGNALTYAAAVAYAEEEARDASATHAN